jgi:hypothetical protein
LLHVEQGEMGRFWSARDGFSDHYPISVVIDEDE